MTDGGVYGDHISGKGRRTACINRKKNSSLIMNSSLSIGNGPELANFMKDD